MSTHEDCSKEVLNYINWSKDSSAGRAVMGIIKKHFESTKEGLQNTNQQYKPCPFCGSNNVGHYSSDLEYEGYRKFLTADELAKKFNIPIKWVRERSREIPGYTKIGHFVRYRKSSVEAAVAGGCLIKK